MLQIPTGKNPRGIVVNSADTTAYVMNYVSRDVTVIDLSGSPERVDSDSEAGQPADARAPPKTGFTSEGAVSHVHRRIRPRDFRRRYHHRPDVEQRLGILRVLPPFGLSDNVVWIFPSGPKRTISQHTDFDQTDANRRLCAR